MAEHLLAIDDVAEDFEDILHWAIEFKRMWKSGDEIAMNFFPLADMAVGSIYEKPSTRTRVSFEVGINRLGGYPLTLLKNDIQLGNLRLLLIQQMSSQDSWCNNIQMLWTRRCCRIGCKLKCSCLECSIRQAPPMPSCC